MSQNFIIYQQWLRKRQTDFRIYIIILYFRSHSPLSPKLRNMGKANAPQDNEATPAKELERLVKEVSHNYIYI